MIQVDYHLSEGTEYVDTFERFDIQLGLLTL